MTHYGKDCVLSLLILQIVVYSPLFSTHSVEQIIGDYSTIVSILEDLNSRIEAYKKEEGPYTLQDFQSELQTNFAGFRTSIKSQNPPTFSTQDIKREMNRLLWEQGNFNSMYQKFFERFSQHYAFHLVIQSVLKALPKAPTQNLRIRCNRLKHNSFASLNALLTKVIPKEHQKKKWITQELEQYALHNVRSILLNVAILPNNKLARSVARKISPQVVHDFKQSVFRKSLHPESEKYEQDIYKKLGVLEQPHSLASQSKKKKSKLGLGLGGFGIASFIILGVIGTYYAYKHAITKKKRFNSLEQAVRYINQQALLYKKRVINSRVYQARKEDALRGYSAQERAAIELRLIKIVYTQKNKGKE